MSEPLPSHPADPEAPPRPPADGASLYRVAVEFGDCDPAGIVYFPNFLRWMDAASRHFFVHRGVPPWRDLADQPEGIIGTPVVDISTRFRKAAVYGDQLAIETAVTAWRGKSFVQRHRVWRGSDLLVEGTEVRVFATRAPRGIRAVPIPASVLALCGPAAT